MKHSTALLYRFRDRSCGIFLTSSDTCIERISRASNVEHCTGDHNDLALDRILFGRESLQDPANIRSHQPP